MILYLWEERGRMVAEEVDDGQSEVRIEEGPPPKPQLHMALPRCPACRRTGYMWSNPVLETAGCACGWSMSTGLTQCPVSVG